MRRFLHAVLMGVVVLPALVEARGQAPPPEAVGPAADELEQRLREVERLRAELAAAQAKGEDEKLRKLVELQQAQLKVLEERVRLVTEQLQAQTAAAGSRAERAGLRDQELANAVDDLREQADAAARHGPALPPTMRELFQPTRPNESPLAIYGTLATNFEDFQDARSNFTSTIFSPHLYLLLNERFLLEVNPDFRSNQVDLDSAQLDWFINDNLTLVFGRFYSPLGFFNERLHTSWVYKTPDRPLIFEQVFPGALSFSGLQLRGAAYPGLWPVKLEYSAFVANGLGIDAPVLGPVNFANLRPAIDTFDDVNNDKAIGGRLGLSFPTLGVIVGISGLANGAYDREQEHDLSVWDIDAGWHWGNWDVRFEYAHTHQQALPRSIRRQGFYAQVAYRPYDHPSCWVRNLEGVLRFDHVTFDGIDLAVTGLRVFGPRERIPVDRNRYTFGLNYYLYPSLIFKVAYEVNDELRRRELHDNGFIAQLTWGF